MNDQKRTRSITVRRFALTTFAGIVLAVLVLLLAVSCGWVHVRLFRLPIL